MIPFWQVTGTCTHLRKPFCSAVFKRTVVNLLQPHVYKKIWKEEELVQYLRSNVTFENDDVFVTSVPQGIGVSEKTKWRDSANLVSGTTLDDLTKKLRSDFSSGYCRHITYPRRNASGLTLLAKNKESLSHLRRNIILSGSKGTLIFSFLAVVMGCPEKVFTREFGVKRGESEKGHYVEIKDLSIACKKCKRVNYQHEVIASTEHVSLVVAEVSHNINDSARHILADRCYTPVFGDSWNCRRKQCFMFGVPLVRDVTIENLEPYELHPSLLEKLQLRPGEEKFIPLHLHLYSLKLPLKKHSEFFASVPPPEYFIWTCHQLGLHEIDRFSLQKTESSEASVAQN